MGFDRAFDGNIDTVFTSEWDKYAQATYSANFDTPGEINGDITKIREKDIPHFDICLAGFPVRHFPLRVENRGSTMTTGGFAAEPFSSMSLEYANFTDLR